MNKKLLNLIAATAIAAGAQPAAIAEPGCKKVDANNAWSLTDKYGANADGHNVDDNAKKARFEVHRQLGAQHGSVGALWTHHTIQSSRQASALIQGRIRDMLSTATVVDLKRSFPDDEQLWKLQGRVLITCLHAVDSDIPSEPFKIENEKEGRIHVSIDNKRFYETSMAFHLSAQTERPSLVHDRSQDWYEVEAFVPVNEKAENAHGDLAVVILKKPIVGIEGVPLSFVSDVPHGAALRIVGYGKGIFDPQVGFSLELREELDHLQSRLDGFGAAYDDAEYVTSARACDAVHQATGWGVRKAFDVLADSKGMMCEFGMAPVCMFPASPGDNWSLKPATEKDEEARREPLRAALLRDTSLVVASPTQSDSGGPLLWNGEILAVVSATGTAAAVAPHRQAIRDILRNY